MSVLIRCALLLVLGTLCSTVATCGQKGPLELPVGGDRGPFGGDVVARVEPCALRVDRGRAHAPTVRLVDHALRA